MLRFRTLGSQSYWFDESLTVALVRAPFGARALGIDTDAEPPLYFLLAWPWGRVFGTAEVGLRSLSAVIGVLTIPAAYSAVRTLVNRRAGLAAASLAAVSPTLIAYSQEARAYALFVLLTVLSLMFFARTLEQGARRDFAGWAITSALAATAHYFALVLALPEAALMLARSRHRRYAQLAVGAVALAGLALAPLALHQRAHGIDWVAGLPLIQRIKDTIRFLLVGPAGATPVVVVVGVVALVVLALRSTDAQVRRGVLIALALAAAAFAVPLAGAAVGLDYFYFRNLLPVWLPFAAVLAAAAGLASQRRLGIALVAVVAAMFLWQQLTIDGDENLHRDDWRAVARAIGAPRAGRVLIVLPGWQAQPLALYHPMQPMRQAHPADEVVQITYDGPRPRPGPRHQSSPPPPFHPVETIHVQRMTVARFRSPRSVTVSPTPRTSDGPTALRDRAS